MKNYLKISACIMILSLFSFNTHAQLSKVKKKKFSNTSNSRTFKKCPTNLASKAGEVFSVAPGILTTKATSDKIFVVVEKTGGRAKTTVNIYVNNVLIKRMIFENGRDFLTKKEPLNGVKGKNIKVEIVNQSVGNSFKYRAKIVGGRKNVMKNGKPVTGTLIGQAAKKTTTNKSCTGKTTIIVKRTGGNARATIRVYENTGNGNYTRLLKSETFEANKNKKELLINSSKKLLIELKNISVGNMLKYKINAFATK